MDPRAARRVDPIITNRWPNCRACFGLFLIERFFSIPGIGREVILAVQRSDFPVISTITVYVAFATIITNRTCAQAVDPRVQLK